VKSNGVHNAERFGETVEQQVSDYPKQLLCLLPQLDQVTAALPGKTSAQSLLTFDACRTWRGQNICYAFHTWDTIFILTNFMGFKIPSLLVFSILSLLRSSLGPLTQGEGTVNIYNERP